MFCNYIVKTSVGRAIFAGKMRRVRNDTIVSEAELIKQERARLRSTFEKDLRSMRNYNTPFN